MAARAVPRSVKATWFPELAPRDAVVNLLHIASEIEHSLMVQYLYAAYSLGGSALDAGDHARARTWREIILGIAKEEMAHLITVQNVLRAIGGPLHLERQDYPYRADFFPFPFRLEPLTKGSLAKYVVAEMPENWDDAEAKRVQARAQRADHGKAVMRVGDLYAIVIGAVGRLSPDSFLPQTSPFQASWDEWGRGYGEGARGNLGRQAPKQTPTLLISTVTDRATALSALRAISKQGEAPGGSSADEESHFMRFLEIYREFPEDDPPSRNIPVNPRIGEPNQKKPYWSEKDEGCAWITNERSIMWAHLLNVRYRMLLYTLKHAFFVSGATEITDGPTARASLISWTFGEMYNLRTISGILVDLALAGEGDERRAAPTFDTPYSISLPDFDSDKWRVHIDLYNASAGLMTRIGEVEGRASPYLEALANSDRLARDIAQGQLDQALAGEANP